MAENIGQELNPGLNTLNLRLEKQWPCTLISNSIYVYFLSLYFFSYILYLDLVVCWVSYVKSSTK